MIYLALKWLHVVSATVLLGTGAGIAFFLWRVQRTGNIEVIAAVTRDVVRADLWFTAVAVVVQPMTGFLLMRMSGYALTQFWIKASLLLFVLIGCCWLPVVWLQLRMRDLAARAVLERTPLPAQYFRHYRAWLVLGCPAFAGVLGILWLMIAKP